MAVATSFSGRSAAFWRRLIAAAVLVAVGGCGVAFAANQSVQGAKKEDGGFAGDAPTAILIEASSGSVLFEKNADELRAPSSMMKLMTVETVFHAIEKGDVKLTDEYHISEHAWRTGGAPSGTSTMFAAINSKVSVDDLLHGAIIQSGNDACIALAEGMAGNETQLRGRHDDQARARAWPDAIDLCQFQRSARPRQQDDGARTGTTGALHHPDLSRVLQAVRPARIHLEQDPPAEPQPAADVARRRRWAQDRIHQGGRLRHGRLCGAKRDTLDRRRQRP